MNFDDLKRLIPPESARPWIALVAIIFGALILMIIGSHAPKELTNQSYFSAERWAFYSWEAGKIALAGGVVGAVTRFLALAGIFRQGFIETFQSPPFHDAAKNAASEAIHEKFQDSFVETLRSSDFRNATKNAVSEAFSEKLVRDSIIDCVGASTSSGEWLDRRSDLVPLWQELTRKIYFPQIRNKSLNSYEISRISKDIEESIHEKFSYDQLHFISDLNRDIILTWASPDKDVICIKERVRCKFVPYESSAELEWKNSRTADLGMSLENYIQEIEEFTVNNTPPPDPDIAYEDEGRKVILKYRLSGSEVYDLYRKRRVSWRLDTDPTMEHTSDYITVKSNITIHNQADGLVILFNEVGGSKLFRRLSGTNFQIGFDKTLDLESQRALLPNQGYLLIFHRQIDQLPG